MNEKGNEMETVQQKLIESVWTGRDGQERTTWWVQGVSFQNGTDTIGVQGFRWSDKRRQWFTSDKATAALLHSKADGDSRTGLAAAFKQADAAYSESRAISATPAEVASIPMPDGTALLPYQAAGVAYAVKHPNSLIADEMGLGKTVQAIAVCNVTKPTKVLIIVPASLRINWQREWAKFTTLDLEVAIVSGGKPAAWPADPQVVVLNYEVVGKHRDAIDACDWDIVICDEAHYLKNPRAQRTKAILGDVVTPAAKRVLHGVQAARWLFLTGTPILNRPIELFPLAHKLAPSKFSSFWGFSKRYCGGHRGRFGWDHSGATNLKELNLELGRNGMARRLKADVLTDLPAKQRQVVPLAPNGAAKAVANERAVYEAAQQQYKNTVISKELAKASDDPRVWEGALADLRKAQSVMFAEIAKARVEVAKAKIPYVVEAVLNSSDKVVVMCWHHVVVDALRDALAAANVEAVTFTGKTPMDERQAAVDSFQTGTAQVFIGTIKAAGVGITLTASSHVIFAELDYVPANILQAEDRCHRIGQRNQVLVQHLVFDGSLDGNMATALVAKMGVIKQAIDDDVDTDLQETVIPDEPVTATVTRKRLIEEAARLTPAQVLAVQQALLIIAGDDADGARERNDVGFNRYDTAIGRELASLGRLTAKQAVLGKRIALKYHRQLGGKGSELITAING
tara:strand:- start:4224 stop:6275 length:2052 start_codon:yes stop_codon:yes gene_type:complete